MTGDLRTMRLLLVIVAYLWSSVDCQECGVKSGPETKLLSCLFNDDYDPMARPVSKFKDVVNVTLSVYLMKVVDVVEKEHIFVSKGWTSMSWKDEFLKWKPEDYGGVTRIWVDAHKVWRPDIMVYNYAQDMYEVMLETPVVILASGEVHWTPNNALIKAYCNLDLTWFPYDKQTCSLVFGSWSYDLTQVDIHPKDNKSAIMPYEGKEWDVWDYSWTRKIFNWAGVADYPAIIYTVKLQRQPTYYRHLFVIPSFILVLLTLCIYLMPVDSTPRLIFGGALLICNTLLTAMLENHLPTELGSLPAVMVYLTFHLVMLATTLLFSIMVLNFYERGNNKSKLPPWIKKIFLGKFSRFLCVPAERYISVPLDDADQNASIINPSELRIDPDIGLSADSSTPPGNSALTMDKTLDEIRRYLRFLSAKAAVPEGAITSHKDLVSGEWQQFATVLDRFLCLIYLVIMLLITAVLYGRRS